MQPSAFSSFNSFGRRSEQELHHRCHYRQKRSHVAPSSSPVDSELPAGGDTSTGVSNLRRFLQYTTPKVLSQLLPNTQLRGLSSMGRENCIECFFSLSDLWDSFDEWSAYGAGVPILLNGKDTVTQYYVPYLSAIQLYSSPKNEFAFRDRWRAGDDSDGSELEYRDSNSETSSVDSERERITVRTSWSSSDMEERKQQSESLLFEYFETSPPAQRIPLFDKIKDLAMQYPGLRTLGSNDLSQSSWFSVAWYPIYRIPTGVTLNDLAACFLTYHSLSTSTSDSGMHSWFGNQVAINSFGLARYKFRGMVWMSAGAADRHHAASLYRNADDWLKRLYVRHPDFEYFRSRSFPGYEDRQ